MMLRLILLLVLWFPALVVTGDRKEGIFVGSAAKDVLITDNKMDAGGDLTCGDENCQTRLRRDVDDETRGTHPNTHKISVVQRGRENTESFRLYFQNPAGPISPFHDIPLYADKKNGILNMVVEIPRWQDAKLEISGELPLNPIVQNVRDGKLYYVGNPFPYNGYSWNYGSLPQTWVPPSTDPVIGKPGDNNPVDVLDIGQKIAKSGDIIQVKVLGIYAPIDEGKANWKVLAINKDDINAPRLNDINDVRTMFQGIIGRSWEWFQIYKIPLGVPENTFLFKNQPQNKSYAFEIIDRAHTEWQELVKGWAGPDGISIASVTLPYAKEKLTPTQAQKIVNAAPKPGPPAPVNQEELDQMTYLVGSDPDK